MHTRRRSDSRSRGHKHVPVASNVTATEAITLEQFRRMTAPVEQPAPAPLNLDPFDELGAARAWRDAVAAGEFRDLDGMWMWDPEGRFT